MGNLEMVQPFSSRKNSDYIFQFWWIFFMQLFNSDYSQVVCLELKNAKLNCQVVWRKLLKDLKQAFSVTSFCHLRSSGTLSVGV